MEINLKALFTVESFLSILAISEQFLKVLLPTLTKVFKCLLLPPLYALQTKKNATFKPLTITVYDVFLFPVIVKFLPQWTHVLSLLYFLSLL